MNIKDSIILSEIDYEIIYCEHPVFYPDQFQLSPIWSDDKEFAYSCKYCLKDYQLYLKSFTVSSDREYPVINGVTPEPCCSVDGRETVRYHDIMESLGYTGSMIIGAFIVKTYTDSDEIPCYCYKYIKELVFSKGKLITAIDHSKAMLRIRRNLDMGLRSLDKKRDVKCIERFIRSSFAGNYADSDKRYKRLLKKVLHRKSYFEKIKKV